MSEWWKFDDDEPEEVRADSANLREQGVGKTSELAVQRLPSVRGCLVCGALIDSDRAAQPLSLCAAHLVEREQVIAEVQALERTAFEAILAIHTLAEQHPAYTPFSAANALVHLSATVQQVERIVLEREALRRWERRSIDDRSFVGTMSRN